MGRLQVTGAYANKLFSFSTISLHFLADFVCKGVAAEDLTVNLSFPLVTHG